MTTSKTPKMFKKSHLALAVASTFAALALTGCGGDSIKSAAPNITTLPKGTVPPAVANPNKPDNNNNGGSDNNNGGSGGNDNNGSGSDNNQAQTPQNPQTQPAAGFFMVGKIRDTSKTNNPERTDASQYLGTDKILPDGTTAGTNLRQALTENDIKPMNFNQFPTWQQLHIDSPTHALKGDWLKRAKVYGYGKLSPLNDQNNTHINHLQDENKKAKKSADNYEHIRFGYLDIAGLGLNQKAGEKNLHNGKMPILFYHGDNVSTQLPSAGTFEYKGNWLYLSDVKKRPALTGKDEKVGTYFNAYSKTNEADEISAAHIYLNNMKYKHTPATYKVDFDKNTLTGKLSYYDNPNKQNSSGNYIASQFDTTKKVNEVDVYQIDGKIQGNRFTGTAKSLITENSKTAPFIKELFSKKANPNNPDPDSNALEGGFYGETGDELAGKFLSNDGSAYVVFGGKRNDKNKKPETKPFYFSAGFEKPIISNISNEDIGKVIEKKKLNEEIDAKIDEGEIPISDDQYESYPWGKPQADFTKQTSTSKQVIPAYFGQHDKFYFNGNYYNLKANSKDNLEVKNANNTQTIKNKYPDVKVEQKDNVTKITLQEKQGDKPYTAINAKTYNHISFGEVLYNDDKNNPTRSYFVQGGDQEQTTTLPSAGKFTYNGLWAGYLIQKKDKGFSNNEDIIKKKGHKDYILAQDFTPESEEDEEENDEESTDTDKTYLKGEIKPEYRDKYLPINEKTHQKTFSLDGKNKASFDVDFDTNTLKGALTDENGHSVFDIKDGKINDTGFTAKADVNNYREEVGNTNSGGFLYDIKDIDVNGQFFGTDGEELAGQLHYDKGDGVTEEVKKAGAVFGAVKGDKK